MNDTTQEELLPNLRADAVNLSLNLLEDFAQSVTQTGLRILCLGVMEMDQCIATLKAENATLKDRIEQHKMSYQEMAVAHSVQQERAEVAQSQAAALQAELTEAKAQWAKWAGLYEHELENCNKAESQAAAMAGLLEEAREWMGEPPIYFQPSAPGSWRARIDAQLAAWKGNTK